MVLTVQRRFGSFALDATNGILVSSWDVEILNSVEHEQRNDGLGSIRTRDAIEGIEVSMSGDITGGGDAENVRDNIDAVMAALRNREDYLQLFSDRRILCGATSSVDLKFKGGTQYALVKWSATFTSRFPTWESTTALSSALTLNVGSAGSATGSMPTNVGAAPAYPHLTVLNNGSAVDGLQLTFTNAGTGAVFSIDGMSIAAGQSVVIDMRERRIGDGLTIPYMPNNISGQFWEISPASSQSLQVSSNKAVNLSITTLFRAQYWSA